MDLARIQGPLENAVRTWVIPSLELFEDDRRLPEPRVEALRVSLPSDRSFANPDAALAQVTGPPLPPATELFWAQGLLDVLLDYEIRSPQARFSLRPGFERLGARVITGLRFLPPGGPPRAFELVGDPGRVRLDPRWHQAALQFVRLGFLHILDGADHLLFLLCLVIPCRRMRTLVLVATSFTLAHSITLMASALGAAPAGLWFPPLVETLIAASIVFMALENILVPRPRARWLAAFGFGLVHGFGFSFALRETLQFAGAHLLTSLLAFNVGVELGQLLVLAVLAPGLSLLFRLLGSERALTIVLSALAAHSGWHWLVERLAILRQYPWPAWTAADLLVLTRWLLLGLGLAGAAWLVARRRRRAARDLSAA
jgi:hypothetical protein